MDAVTAYNVVCDIISWHIQFSDNYSCYSSWSMSSASSIKTFCQKLLWSNKIQQNFAIVLYNLSRSADVGWEEDNQVVGCKAMNRPKNQVKWLAVKLWVDPRIERLSGVHNHGDQSKAYPH